MQISESWAVRYRPRKLKDFIGQPEAVAMIKGMQKRQEFPNALLITGPTGSGKTTLARVIASLVNDLEGDKVESHPDIVEMNIGTENRVDDARDLTNKLDFIPHRNFRVFILDEIHKQTSAAASALLKSLEEPPDHVIFILVTNLPSKLLDTIRNRCVTINLKFLKPEDIYQVLKRVAVAENLKKTISKDLLERISKTCSGNPRESVQLLQATANLIAGGFDPKKALKESVLQLGSYELDRIATKFLLGVYQGNLKVAVSTIYDTEDHGGLLRVLTELHAYLPAVYTQKNTYHSPARKSLVKLLDSRSATPKLEKVLQVHHEIISSRLEAGTYQVPERDVLLSLIGRLQHKYIFP